MNNWTGPKYMIAEGDTYMKYPDDETFPQLMVNYVKLDRVPKFKDGWTPVLDKLAGGRLLRDQRRGSVAQLGHRRHGREAYAIPRKRNGRSRRNSPSWCGATAKVDRQIISLTEMGPFQATSSACRSTPRARSGCVSRFGIRREMARSLSLST